MDKLTTPVLNFYIAPGNEFNLDDFLGGRIIDMNQVIGKITTEGVELYDNAEFGPAPGEGPDEVELGGEVGPRFRATILQEGVSTSDRRVIKAGAVDIDARGQGQGRQHEATCRIGTSLCRHPHQAS